MPAAVLYPPLSPILAASLRLPSASSGRWRMRRFSPSVPVCCTVREMAGATREPRRSSRPHLCSTPASGKKKEEREREMSATGPAHHPHRALTLVATLLSDGPRPAGPAQHRPHLAATRVDKPPPRQISEDVFLFYVFTDRKRISNFAFRLYPLRDLFVMKFL